jgi:hypothetical protein
LLLEAIISVLSPLFAEESCEQTEGVGGGQVDLRETLGDRTDSEISIFLVCAEMRVAFSLCHHFSKLPKLLVSDNK